MPHFSTRLTWHHTSTNSNYCTLRDVAANRNGGTCAKCNTEKGAWLRVPSLLNVTHQRYSRGKSPQLISAVTISVRVVSGGLPTTRQALTESNVERYSGPLNMGWTCVGPPGHECSGFDPWLGVRGWGPDSALISPLGVGTWAPGCWFLRGVMEPTPVGARGQLKVLGSQAIHGFSTVQWGSAPVTPVAQGSRVLTLKGSLHQGQLPKNWNALTSVAVIIPVTQQINPDSSWAPPCSGPTAQCLPSWGFSLPPHLAPLPP